MCTSKCEGRAECQACGDCGPLCPQQACGALAGIRMVPKRFHPEQDNFTPQTPCAMVFQLVIFCMYSPRLNSLRLIKTKVIFNEGLDNVAMIPTQYRSSSYLRNEFRVLQQVGIYSIYECTTIYLELENSVFIQCSHLCDASSRFFLADFY